MILIVCIPDCKNVIINIIIIIIIIIIIVIIIIVVVVVVIITVIICGRDIKLLNFGDVQNLHFEVENKA